MEEKIIEKLAECKQKFNTLHEKKRELENAEKQILVNKEKLEMELLRCQGEHRALNGLLGKEEDLDASNTKASEENFKEATGE